MLVTKSYERSRAVEYARRYAFSQNPVFGNFRGIGGNCTNFVSQCIYAGACKMNYTPTFGWYYISMDERAPAWTGVEYFSNFMTSNSSVGPYGRFAEADECEIGDVVQLGRENEGFYHTLLIVGFDADEILVAAQTDDALDRPLSSYDFDFARFIKILGVRFDTPSSLDCFEAVYNGISIIPSEPAPQLNDGAGTALDPMTESTPSEPITDNMPQAPDTSG